MDGLKLFKKFLEDNNALQQFVTNTTANCGYSTLKVFPEEILFYSFNWSLSPEGHDFWRDLNSDWVNLGKGQFNKKYKMEDVVLYLSTEVFNEEESWTI